jgi:TolB-like protein
MSLFTELKRRNVIRVAVFYLLAAWLLVQVAETVLPVFEVPDGVLRGLVIVLVLGFVPALVFAWIYELTPEGLKRESQIATDRSITHRTGHKLNLSTLAVAVLAVGLMAWDRFGPERVAVSGPEAGSPATPPAATADSDGDGRASIAVLAFDNMSADPENLYFAEGISEEILNVLAGIDGLKVASRTSAFSFKGSGTPIPEIAEKLDVAHVLEGSVRKSGARVRITAQLIEAATDAHLWSDSYDRELTDIFAVQDEIARAIVAALKLTLTGARRAPDSRTDDVEAYSRYLKGRFFWHQRTIDGFVSAERELRRAVEIDPDYADAWAALADVYVLQPEYGAAPAAEAIPKARAAIDQALALDPDSARALASRGYLRYQFDWDWAGAEADFLRAIALDPGYATAHQ